MAALRHPYLVRLVGICLQGSPVMVNELVPCGPLNAYLVTHKGRLGTKDVLRYISQVAIAYYLIR